MVSLPSPDETESILARAARVAAENAERRASETQKLAPERPTPACVISDEEAATATARAEEQRRKDVADRLLEAAAPPKRYAAASLAQLARVPADVHAAYADAAARVARLTERPAILGLVGDRGPGKTWIGWGLVLDFCRAARPAMHLKALDYFAELKRTYGASARRDESAVETDYLRPELLVIDELHERGDTPWEDRMLSRLVDKRYDAMLATLLISNQTVEAFKERVGPSIADRMKEDGGGIIVCDWPSVRGRIQS